MQHSGLRFRTNSRHLADGGSRSRTEVHQMKIGPRFLSKQTNFSDVTAERAALLTSLEAAPGMDAIEGLEPHLKGGHRASLMIDGARLDDFIAHMDAQGWMDGF